MLEVNVPADRLEGVVAILPCMREPTIAPLHHDAGFAVKAAVPRADLPGLIRAIKEQGGTDIVVFEHRADRAVTDAAPRTARVERRTGETEIRVELNLDGEGLAEVETGLGFLDHMLTALAKHGRLRPRARVRGRPRRRRPPHRRGLRPGAGRGHRPGAGRAPRHPPLRPRLRAARRGAGPGRGRLLRPALGACRPGLPARADRRHRHREPDPLLRLAGDRPRA